jgi:hypothetical protein
MLTLMVVWFCVVDGDDRWSGKIVFGRRRRLSPLVFFYLGFVCEVVVGFLGIGVNKQLL